MSKKDINSKLLKLSKLLDNIESNKEKLSDSIYIINVLGLCYERLGIYLEEKIV